MMGSKFLGLVHSFEIHEEKQPKEKPLKLLTFSTVKYLFFSLILSTRLNFLFTNARYA